MWRASGAGTQPACHFHASDFCCSHYLRAHKLTCMECLSSVPYLITSVSWKQQSTSYHARKTFSSSSHYWPGASNPIAASPMPVISSDTLHRGFMTDFLLCSFALGVIPAYQETKHCKLAHTCVSRVTANVDTPHLSKGKSDSACAEF